MNDLDPLLTEAMARVQHPTGARPSITDVHRRARRHNRRRMTATVGAVACTGVATAALIIRRDAGETTSVAATGETDDTAVPIGEYPYPPTTIYVGGPGATTTTFPSMAAQQTVDASFVWEALSNVQGDPSAAGLTYPADLADDGVMPTAEMFGCASAECGAMFNYIVWHGVAAALGFLDVWQMQAMNPSVDFSQPPQAGELLQSVASSYIDPPPTTVFIGDTTTTISLSDGIVLIDGGAPQGAMEDAYQRLNGYNRTIVPSSGKSVEQTMVMPIGDNTPIAGSVLSVFGVDGFDTWDPSLVGAPVEGMVAVVIGADYFERVGGPASTTTTLWPTTTIVGP